MPRYIIHKDGVYNFYTTIADGACYESGLTAEQVTEIVELEQGQEGLRGLPERMDRARKYGCSALPKMSLEECVACNRAGQNETELSLDDFVAKYLTL